MDYDELIKKINKNYWVFGLSPEYGIVKTKKQTVLRWG
jgi:hypothetical protein